MNANRPFGEYVAYADLDAAGQQLITSALDASQMAYCFQSNFPVGSAVLAENAAGDIKAFHGCNVENNFFSATICGERNAGTSAVAEGYTRFRMVALFCRKVPGGSPCGACRQFLSQFGRDATMIYAVDHDKNVRRATVGDLLPVASGVTMTLDRIGPSDIRLVARLAALKQQSYAPYSKNPRGAIFRAANAMGVFRDFAGMTCDNAAYGSSIAAESIAMYAARTEGFTEKVMLAVGVDNVYAPNPLDGNVLQVLREFGKNADIMLVDDKQVLVTELTAVFPDSFGPDSL